MRAEPAAQSFFFDVLALDGVPLIDRPGEERIAALSHGAAGEPAHPAHRDRSAGRGRRRSSASARRGPRRRHGRNLHAAYEAGARGKSWLKVKSATTLDLVVLAAEWGNGRRQGWLSNRILARATR